VQESRLKKVLKWFAIVFLLLPLVAAGGLYLALPSLLGMAAKQQLANQGYILSHFDINSLSLQQASIRRLQFHSADASKKFKLSRVNLSYSWQGLLEGRIEALLVERIDAQIQPDNVREQDGVTPSLRPLLPVSVHRRLSALPIARMEARHVRLQLLGSQGQIRQTVTGSAKYAEQQLEAGLKAYRKGLWLGALAVDLDANGKLTVKVLHSGSEKEDSEALNIQVQERHLQGLLHLDIKAEARLEPLMDLLAPWLGGSGGLPEVAGRIGAVASLDLPEEGLDGLRHGTLPEALRGKADFSAGISMRAHGEAVERFEFHGKGGLKLKGKDLYWHVDSAGRGALTFADAAMKPLVFHIGQKGISVAVQLDRKALASTIFAGASVCAEKMQINGMTLAPFSIFLQRRFDGFTNSSGEAAPARLRIAPLQVRGSDYSLRQKGIDLHISRPRKQGLNIRSTLQGLNVKYKEITFNNNAIEFNIDVINERVRAAFSVHNAAMGLTMNGKALHHWTPGQGGLELRLAEINFAKATETLKQWMTSLSPLTLAQGKATIAWNSIWKYAPDGAPEKMRHLVRINLNKLGGSFQDFAFDGLTTRIAMQGQNGLHSVTPAHISLNQFIAGLTVKALSLDVAAHAPWLLKEASATSEKPSFEVTGFSAELLGGKIKARPFTIDLNKTSQTFPLELEHIELAQLLALEKQEHLFGEGVLDGSLPVIWDEDGLTMPDGIVNGRAPGGIIRYLGDARTQAMAKGNPGMRLLLNSVSDFHYKQMGIHASYLPGGDLILKTSLKGHNPSFQNGRQVHFNVTIEENIPILLRSLSMADEFTDRIEQQITPEFGDDKTGGNTAKPQ